MKLSFSKKKLYEMVMQKHPIYTHIPQYPEITGYFFIPSYNRMVPLLTIFYKKGIRP